MTTKPDELTQCSDDMAALVALLFEDLSPMERSKVMTQIKNILKRYLNLRGEK